MGMKVTYSTAEVARVIEVDKTTLLRWLYNGKLKEPKQQKAGGVTFRIWTEQDLERARKHRAERYRRRP